jgi:hypothetical protein
MQPAKYRPEEQRRTGRTIEKQVAFTLVMKLIAHGTSPIDSLAQGSFF